MASGGISREWFNQGRRNFTDLSRTIGLTNIPERTSLATFGRLQIAIKYCTKRPGSGRTEANISILFNLISQACRDIRADIFEAILDMTSPAASGRQLSKFKKRPKMSHPTAVFALSALSKASSNFSREEYISNLFELSGVAFRLATPFGGLLIQVNRICLLMTFA